MNTYPVSRPTLILLIAMVAASTSHSSVVRVWEGNTDTTLLTPGNWSGDVAPVTNDALQFGVAGSAGTTINTASDINFGFSGATPAINFTSGASAYTFGGAGIITVGTGAITNASGQTQTFNGALRFNTGNNYVLTNANSRLVFGGPTIELNADTHLFVLGSAGGQSVTFGGNLILGTVNPTTAKNLHLNGGGSNSTVTLNGVNNSGLTGTLRIGSNMRVNIGSATGLSAVTTVNMNGGNAQIVNTSGSALATNASLAVTTTSPITFGQAGDTAANSMAFNGTAAISGDLNRTITLNGSGLTVTSASVWNNTEGGNRSLTVNGAGNTLALAGIAIGASGETANVTFTLAGSGNVTVSGGVTNGLGTGTRALQVNSSGTLTLNGASNYSGGTGVGGSATLLVNGTHTGGTNYSVGGTLGGTGTIDLSANNAAIAFTSSGANRRLFASSTDGLTLIGGASPVLNLTNAAGRTDGLQSFFFTLGIPGTTVVDVQGGLNIGSGTLEFGDFSFGTASGFGEGVYRLFDYTSIVGTLGANLTGTIGGLGATISNDALNSAVIVTVIPEPSSLPVLAGLAVAGLAVSRRRRRT